MMGLTQEVIGKSQGNDRSDRELPLNTVGPEALGHPRKSVGHQRRVPLLDLVLVQRTSSIPDAFKRERAARERDETQDMTVV